MTSETTPLATSEPHAVSTPQPRSAHTGRSRRKWAVGLIIVVAMSGTAAAVAIMNGYLPYHVAGNPKASGFDDSVSKPAAASVRVVRPKLDPSVQVAIEQLASVEAYFRADLRARASGVVRSVTKDIGDRVNVGDLLIDIDVPEFAQEVAQKEAAVRQRLQEVNVARAMARDADAKREVAKTTVRQRQAETLSAEATADLRRKRLTRFKSLAARDTIGPDVLEEQEKEVQAADAAVMASRVAIERAQADLTEADARIEAAVADIDLKTAIVDVARRDLERSRAVAEYAHVTAPFDGVVVRRVIDPGSFVQNATTGQSETLISIARTDMVTIAARFTDAAAPFVTAGTEAEIVMNNLPGVTLRGRVTRFAPSVQNSDRTMRVEVDLFTGTDREHRALVSRVLGAELAPLSAAEPLGLVASRIGERRAVAGLHKGDSDLLAARTVASAGGAASTRLLPGMTGNMKLLLRQFPGGFVIPSAAIYSRTGRPYVLLVENGVTKQYPVTVQVNDRRMAKVVIVKPKRDAGGSVRDESAELTGREEVVVARQLEIGEGQKVQTSVTEW